MVKYLTATRDRDGDPDSGRKYPVYYFEKFCKLSYDPASMVDSLFKEILNFLINVSSIQGYLFVFAS